MFAVLKSLFSNNDKDKPVFLIVGLGNPGDKYKGNRHNIGFMVADEIASDHGFSPFRKKFQGQLSEGRLGGQKAAILKPETYMNESGSSVGAAVKFFKIEPENIIVFFDELDLAPGKMRVRLGGGNAGHNGLKSLQQHLGTADFKRVRIGIGHPGDKKRVSGYVLSDFYKEDQIWVEKMLPALSKHVETLVQGENELYMTKVSQDINH